QESCLLLARHGETDWNAMKIIQGQQDRPLNPNGFRQRKNLFFLLRPVPLERIYCSTLQRTIQTAMPLSVEKNLPLEERPELNEAKLGVFEGENKEDFSDEFSKKCYQEFLNDEVNVILPGGGENLKMVDKRVRGLIASTLKLLGTSKHTLMVGHRNVNKMIIRNLMGLSFEEGYEVEHKNAWLYIYAPKKAEIFLSHVPSPQEPIEVLSGYEKIEMTLDR
ncbi:MAG: histidine phosphatase family protein, partial [Deltaproteobacteria bacterium]|nr:histidine phosphatase family protein [Deltaproteobacteria bacterium]